MFEFMFDYSVIIGDIINSKSLNNRLEVQENLKRGLSYINDKYANDIAADFSITLGDEFQGLLKSRKSIMNIILDLELLMLGVDLRFGIGIGDVVTHINRHKSSEVDGSAYHRAREMMDKFRGNKSNYTKISQTVLIKSEEDSDIDVLLNVILSTTSALKSKWTQRQKEVIASYVFNSENQYESAKQMGVVQSTISRALTGADYYTFKAAYEVIAEYLGKDGE